MDERRGVTGAVLVGVLVAGLAAVLAAVAGCSNGGSAGGDAGALALALAIARPGPTSYANGRIEIEVQVTGSPGAGGEVGLFANGLPLAGLSGPYSFTWDTTYVLEGTYVIDARATVGGNAVSSAPVTIVVDRTPPRIASQTPFDGAGNVPVRDPVRISFTEPIAPGSVSNASVSLSTGTNVPVTVALDGDRTLSVTLTAPAAVSLPTTLRMSVAASLTDLAGNAFVPVAPTSWTLPVWLDLVPPPPGYGGLAGIVVGPGGVLSALGYQGSPQLATIARYTGGTSWDTGFGTPQTDWTRHTVLAADRTGTPWLAWLGVPDANGIPVSVAKWADGAWLALPPLRAPNGQNASAPITLKFDKQGRPVINWPASETGEVHVARWSGSAWQFPYGVGLLKGINMVLGGLDQPALVVGHGQGAAAGIAWWRETVWWTWDWTNASDNIRALAFDPMERLLVMLYSGRVLRGDSFEEVIPAPPKALSSGSVVFDSHGYPMLVGVDSSPDGLFLARWNGGAWDLSATHPGASVGSIFQSPTIAIDANDVVYATWDQPLNEAGDSYRTVLRKLNR